MFDATEAISQIDHLLDEYKTVASDSNVSDLSDRPNQVEVLVVRMDALINRLTLPGSSYRASVEAIGKPGAVFKLHPLVGVARALRADLDAGWLSTIAELLHAETFGDFIDMAIELLDKGYKDPAAVLAGSVLESHLRLLSAKHGVATTTRAGEPKKADLMNADLVKADVYNKMVQKQITALLGLRNYAAHGEYAEYDDAQVRSMIGSVRDFVARDPA